MSPCLTILVSAALLSTTTAFVPASVVNPRIVVANTKLVQSSLHLMDPSLIGEAANQFLSSSNTILETNPLLLSFADQGQNLAGIFFQASLLPYLAFLYFLSFRGNRIPDLGNFGFQFVLLFVMATIPSGIISKATYGCSLADVDWLHGGAEALLTIANVLLVLGFKEATKKDDEKVNLSTGRTVALGAAGLFAVACALGPTLGAQAHSPFLLGAGNLGAETAFNLPFVSNHVQPHTQDHSFFFNSDRQAPRFLVVATR